MTPQSAPAPQITATSQSTAANYGPEAVRGGGGGNTVNNNSKVDELEKLKQDIIYKAMANKVRLEEALEKASPQVRPALREALAQALAEYDKAIKLIDQNILNNINANSP
jgi:hypothetical protein